MTSFKDIRFGQKSLIRSLLEAGSLQIVALGLEASVAASLVVEALSYGAPVVGLWQEMQA